MNLDEAIAKHAEWKVKFRSAIGKKEKLDAPAISVDNRCDLGKWLHGEGKMAHGAKAEYRTLVARHAEFHKAAGKVAEAINAGKYDVAEKMLAPATEYGVASSNVATAITSLKKHV
ncbi:MAG: CZB domain-containing protein [Burkholderiales bacterium]